MKSLIASACCSVALVGSLAAQDAPAPPAGPGAPTVVEETVVRTVTARSTTADVYLLEEAREAQPGLWVALAARIPAGGRLPPSLHACAVAGAPLVARCVALATPGAANSEEPFAAESLAVDDLDGDGEPELRVVINYQGLYTRPGVGADMDRMFVVDLVPRPRVALAVELRRYTEVDQATTRRAVSFTDANEDGHVDALVEETTCRESAAGERCTPVRRTILIWNRRTGWAPARAR
jgi:hypothetical protein